MNNHSKDLRGLAQLMDERANKDVRDTVDYVADLIGGPLGRLKKLSEDKDVEEWVRDAIDTEMDDFEQAIKELYDWQKDYKDDVKDDVKFLTWTAKKLEKELG